MTSKKHKEDADKNECKPNGWKRKVSDPIVWFTGVLAIATLGLVCIANKTDQTLQETKRSNIDAERALLSILPDTLGVIKAANLNPVIHYKVKNYGRSHARISAIKFCVVIVDDPTAQILKRAESTPVCTEYLIQHGRGEQTG